jgi:BlaI family penicillinase repressor
MPREPQYITEGELAVLRILWEKPSASIRQITQVLYPKKTASHYGTVQKQLERMEGKGFVRRDRSLFVHLFSAAVNREELVGRRVDAVVDKLCGGSLSLVISHLLRAPRLTPEERKRLRSLLDDEEPGAGKAGKSEGRR